VPRRRRHCLAVDYNTANPALRVAALAQNATDEPVEATSENRERLEMCLGRAVTASLRTSRHNALAVHVARATEQNGAPCSVCDRGGKIGASSLCMHSDK